MGFRITPKPTFTIPVELHVPGADEPAVIKVEYKYLNREQLQEFKTRHGDKPINEPLEELLVSWDGPEDEEGSLVAYTPARLKQLLAENHVAGDQMLAAYYREVYGARRKN